MREAERKRLVKLLDQNCGYVEEQKAEELADYLLESGVIVPPCKVGQTVWIINSRYDCLQRRFIKFINEGYVKAIKISMKPMKITIEYPDVDDSKGRCKGADYSAQSIGKTVFLSREEAEYALKLKRSVSLINGHIEE